MPAWLGPLIGAAGSVLGGLFGGKEKSETTVDYVAMRKAAEKAGFNPLTVLRAGGGAGFTTTHHPSLASGEFIANALAGVGNAIASIDPMRDATAKLEYEIKQATLANIQADTASRFRSYSLGGVPVSTGARNVRVSSPLAANAGTSRTPTVEVPTVTNPWPTGSGIRVHPGWVDAEAFETRYGDSEIASMVGGILTAGPDLAVNMPKGGFVPMPHTLVQQTKGVTVGGALSAVSEWWRRNAAGPVYGR